MITCEDCLYYPICDIPRTAEECGHFEKAIIRCKDCKYRCETEDGEYNPEDIVCTYWMSDGLNEDDYCSYAERKGK